MFSMTCTHCHTTRLMNTHSIQSMHRTLEGTVAYVRCHCGKTTIHLFERLNAKARRPESVDLCDEQHIEPIGA